MVTFMVIWGIFWGVKSFYQTQGEEALVAVTRETAGLRPAVRSVAGALVKGDGSEAGSRGVGFDWGRITQHVFGSLGRVEEGELALLFGLDLFSAQAVNEREHPRRADQQDEKDAEEAQLQ